MEKQFKKYENILRSIKTEEKILKHTKRVQSFYGNDALSALAESGCPCSKELLSYLLFDNIIFRIQINEKSEEDCEILLDTKFTEKGYYIWTKEKTSHFSLILSVMFILATFCLVMFQMWPSNIKYLASYASYPIGGFIALLVILGFLRLVLFGITFFSHPPGIWLFPNLFADVGFVESFIPVWEYSGGEKSD